MSWCAKCQAFCVFYSTCKDCKAVFCNDCPLTSSSTGDRCANCHRLAMAREKAFVEEKARGDKKRQQMITGVGVAGGLIACLIVAVSALRPYPSCPAPVGEGILLKNGDQNCSFPLPHGSRCTPTCLPGYVKVGAGDRLECARGMWLGQFSCQEKSCSVDSLPAIPHLASVGCQGSVRPGATCEVKCEEGYTVEGSLRCRRGSWEAPVCISLSPQSSSISSSISSSPSGNDIVNSNTVVESDDIITRTIPLEEIQQEKKAASSVPTLVTQDNNNVNRSSSGSSSSSSGSSVNNSDSGMNNSKDSQLNECVERECPKPPKDTAWMWPIVVIIFGVVAHNLRSSSLVKTTQQQERQHSLAEKASKETELAELRRELETHKREALTRERKIKMASTFSRAVQSAMKQSQQKSAEAESVRSLALQDELNKALGVLDMTQKHLNAELEDKKSREEVELKNKQDRECVMCLSQPKAAICMPCGHICLCVDCMELEHQRCPMCQTPIERISRVFS